MGLERFDGQLFNLDDERQFAATKAAPGVMDVKNREVKRQAVQFRTRRQPVRTPHTHTHTHTHAHTHTHT